ncbi:hypothetical protein ABZY05_20250 [Streptomyces canus]|uniref:hypothetical protein n=1 Tax=Streptomyces canus TaxID=58343 RepID=UPI0033AB09DF
MSKAHQLGAGRFDGTVRTVSARRQAVAAATGVPTDGVAHPPNSPPTASASTPTTPAPPWGISRNSRAA